LFLCSRHVFFNDTATTEIYSLSLHDALPISALLALGGFIYVLISRRNFLKEIRYAAVLIVVGLIIYFIRARMRGEWPFERAEQRSEEHTSELQSRENLVCRLLLEKKK